MNGNTDSNCITELLFLGVIYNKSNIAFFSLHNSTAYSNALMDISSSTASTTLVNNFNSDNSNIWDN